MQSRHQGWAWAGDLEMGLSRQALSFVNFRLLTGIGESGMQSPPVQVTSLGETLLLRSLDILTAASL
jgi:hypothetical protein